MSTILAKESYCGWCGASDAPSVCACQQISFCNKDCLRAAWPSHRLVCSKGGQSSQAYSKGDIVVMEGLTSEKGRTLNGLLAEVQSFDEETERFALLFTPKPFQIKSVAIKQGNLRMKQTVRDAALRSVEVEKKSRKKLAESRGRNGEPSEETQKTIKEAVQLHQRGVLQTLSAAEFVERIRQGDKVLLQAMQLPGFDADFADNKKLELFENGLIDACLERFLFPFCIDGDFDASVESGNLPLELGSLSCSPFQLVLLLANFLAGRRRNTLPFNRYRVEVCQKMAPLIMIAASMKRRLYGSTEHWWCLQHPFFNLINNCLLAQDPAIAALYALPSEAVSALTEHMVLALTVDLKVFLRNKSVVLTTNVTNEVPWAMAIFPALMELTDYRCIGMDRVKKFGLYKVPAGAKGVAGRTFASCLLDVFARGCVDVADKLGPDRVKQMLDEARYIYSSFLQSPALAEEMGDFDYEFAHGVSTADEFIRWSRRRMASSPMA